MMAIPMLSKEEEQLTIYRLMEKYLKLNLDDKIELSHTFRHLSNAVRNSNYMVDRPLIFGKHT